MIAQAEYVRLKRRLATLEGKLHRSVENYCLPVNDEADPRIPIYRAMLAEVRYAFSIFDREGYPDAWGRWRSAADDAAWQLGHFYSEPGPELDFLPEWAQ